MRDDGWPGDDRLAVAADGSGPLLVPSIGEYPVYDPATYGALTRDEVRNRPFRDALAARVAGRSVLDLGAGAHLDWARYALESGAREVVAVEQQDDAYAAAEQLRRDLDVGDRLRVVHSSSFDLELERRAEVCVSETVGTIAGSEGVARVFADAHRRLLVPGARCVPSRVETWAAAVDLTDLLGGPPRFHPDGPAYLRAVFDWAGEPFDLRLAVLDPRPDAVVTDTALVETLALEAGPALAQCHRRRLVARRDGSIDAIILWMRLEGTPGHDVLDAWSDRCSWPPVVVPLFDPPVPVRTGDPVHLSVHARLGADAIHPDYHVDCRIPRPRGPARTSAWASMHRGGGVGRHRLYRELFRLPATA